MDAEAAARRWRDAWLRSWPIHDADAIAALYADGATYRSHPLRDPEEGGALGYVTRAFAEEQLGTTCRFGEPLVDRDRAAVEYWAVLNDLSGVAFTLAGTSVLRFAPMA